MNTGLPGADVLFYGSASAAIALRFEATSPGAPSRVGLLTPVSPQADLERLAAARLIVIGDPLYAAWSGTLTLLDAMEVPWALFLDGQTPLDGTWRIREQAAAEAVADAAARARGLIADCTTRAGAAAEGFRRTVLAWPPIYDARLASPLDGARGPTAPLRVAILGGSARREGFVRAVEPALDRLRAEQSVEVYARFDLARGTHAPSLVPVPPESSLAAFVRRWRTLRPHVALLPPGGPTGDAAASALVARYLGALPVMVPGEAEALGPSQGVVLAGPDPASWLEALRVAAAPDRRACLLGNLDRWCQEVLDPAGAAERFATLDAWSAAPNEEERRARIARARAMPLFDELPLMLARRCADPIPPPLSFPSYVRAGLVYRARRILRLDD